MKKIDRTGEKSTNVYGEEMVITDYVNNKEIYVLFPKKNVTRKTSYYAFKHGKVYPTYKNKVDEDYDEYTHNYNLVATALILGGAALLALAGYALVSLF